MNQHPIIEKVALDELTGLLDDIAHISEESQFHKTKVKYLRKIEALAANREVLFRKAIDGSMTLTPQQKYFYKEAVFTSNDVGSNIGFSVYAGFIGIISAISVPFVWKAPEANFMIAFSFVFLALSASVFVWQYQSAKKKLVDIKNISQRLYIEIENKKLLLGCPE